MKIIRRVRARPYLVVGYSLLGSFFLLYPFLSCTHGWCHFLPY